MANSIEPLRKGDLPDMGTSCWRLAGPGAIMVGMAVGSGELILWPWITARFGAVMAWAPMLAVFLQIWINLEIGRWAIATGETALAGLARASVKISYVFMGLLLALTMLPGWQRAVSATVRFLIFGSDETPGLFARPWEEGSVWGSDWLWYLPVTAAVWIVLLGPKRIYDGLEKIVTLLVLVIVVGLIVVVLKIGTMQKAKDLAGGIVSLPPTIQLNVAGEDVNENGELDPGEDTNDNKKLDRGDFPFYRFFGALVFAGVGGFGNLYYAYYLRDKGIGMGKRFPMLAVDIRGKQERANETGYRFNDTPENQKRFREWFNFVKFDTWVIFGLTSVVTLFLFMFAALVALYPQEQGFAQNNVIFDLSGILGKAMGTFGTYLFLVIAIAALFSTVLANVDGGIRMWIDLIHKGFPSTQKWSAGSMYVPLMLTLWTIGFTSFVILEISGVSILGFFFINAAINGCAMAIYVPAILYLNLKYLPKSARPGVVNIFFVICATALYTGFAVYMVLKLTSLI